MTEVGIKYNCEWIKADPINSSEIEDLNYWRNKLYHQKMIGEDAEGIGYGNISKRFGHAYFIISGATTGKIENLNSTHYTVVTEFNISTNSLICKGPIIASSESMTHGTIYNLNSDIGAVIHIHDIGLWNEHLNKLPTTNKNVEYGTPAMAREIIRLYEESDLKEKKVLIMAGHISGLVSFGVNLQEAFETITSLENNS